MKGNVITLEQINRFPVKGLSAEVIDSVLLTAGEGVPGDRLFGFARYNSGFDADNPKPLPKDNFVVLLNQAGLAGLQTSFDSATQRLKIAIDTKTRQFEMCDASGRQEAASFLSRILDLSDPEPPRFVSSAPHRFTDVSVISPAMMNAISVLNLASVRAFEEQIGAEIHPARFRANLLIDGLPPYFELGAVGSLFAIGDVQFRIVSRTKRCAATEVNPETAARDLKLPYLLRKHLGHMDMGVYVEVVKGGDLRRGGVGQMHDTAA